LFEARPRWKRQEHSNVNSGKTSLANACKCQKQDAVNASIVRNWQAYCFGDACTCQTQVRQGVAFVAAVSYFGYMMYGLGSYMYCTSAGRGAEFCAVNGAEQYYVSAVNLSVNSFREILWT
jgi:hypothetical protein